jgi:phytoene dehydrogenase-like protein
LTQANYTHLMGGEMTKIVIIGAGFAGLSAGIYARRNGYETTIYEMHYLPGGMCTAWRRKGFTFEGCLHYVQLVGSSPAHSYYRLWKELGVVPDTVMIHHEVFHTFRDRSGRTLNMYADANRLEEELLSLSPSDAKEIKALCKAVKRCSWFVRTTGKNPFRLVAKAAGIVGGIRSLKEYGGMNLAEYAARFDDPLIRSALSHLFVYPDFAYVQLCFFLAGLHIGGTGYPQGGSLSLAKRVERTFLELDGKIEYRQKVKRIEVKDGRATGIELEDGATVAAEIVISAADGHTTLYEMLEDRYTTPAQRERYAAQPLYHPFIQVSLGVNRDLSDTPHAVKVQTAVPFEVAGRAREELWYQHFAFDPTMAPPGKTAVTVLYPSELAWWEQFGYPSEGYRAEKIKILDTTIAQLERVLPGISSQIETSDVATPFTTFRYTNNWKAALGFIMTQTLAAEMTRKPQYALPGLDGFYMIGQWVKGFGVPMAASSGKEVIQAVCSAGGSAFRAE